MKLITDRTQADVLEGTEKGYYTLRDLDRVEAAVEFLCGELPKLAVFLSLTVHTQWQQQRTMPTAENMKRYLDNVREVVSSVGLHPALPESMENLDYQGANQIESALEQVWEEIRNYLETQQKSGL